MVSDGFAICGAVDELSSVVVSRSDGKGAALIERELVAAKDAASEEGLSGDSAIGFGIAARGNGSGRISLFVAHLGPSRMRTSPRRIQAGLDSDEPLMDCSFQQRELRSLGPSTVSPTTV